MRYILVSIFTLILSLVGATKPLQNLIELILVPIQFGLNTSAKELNAGISFFGKTKDIHNENLALQKKVLDLESEIVSIKRLLENSSLYQEQNTAVAQNDLLKEFKYEEVLVMGNVSDNSNSTVIINKGSRNKIKVKDPLVIGLNLVGIVRTVGYSKSTVELITSPNLSFTVFDIDSPEKTQGLLTGKYGFTLSMERILQAEDIKINDTIVTSGKDGNILPGFIVGKVTKIISDPSQPLKSAEVTPNVVFSKITTAFVVISEEQ